VNIVQITPGAGGMYCGNCFRDNALVHALRQLTHSVLMVPLYLPMTLDEEDESAGTRVFFGGVNVYLQQKSSVFRHLPRPVHQWLSSPPVLKWASGRAAKTRAEDVGELTLSMMRGEEGQQSRELDELIGWLKSQPRPDVICLSNALLIGLVRRLKQDLGTRVVCMLQGEDSFLDSLPPKVREDAWALLSARAQEVDLFIGPSNYYANTMRRRMSIPGEKVSVVYNGINLEGFGPASTRPNPPVIGYFARMCREKGLDTLVDAYIRLRRRNIVPGVRLKVGGGCGPGDEAFVTNLQEKLEAEGLITEVEFRPNLSRNAKRDFLQSLSVFSVPALYGEAFGLYLLEAWACGIPVVQPRHAAFPELVERTGGGVLCEPGDADALANGLENLLLDPARAVAMGQSAQAAMTNEFSMQRMAERVLQVYSQGLPAKAR
jgi:glycosyltransferase involved in cell wall biosynthesis